MSRRSLLPGLTVLLGGYAIFFVFFVLEPAVMQILNADIPQASYLLFEHSIIDGSFIYSSWLLLSVLCEHRATLADMGLEKCSPWFFAWIPLFFIIVLIGQDTWVAFLTHFYASPVPLPNLASFSMQANRPITDIVSVFIFCILAPVAEEIFFRGLIFRWLVQKYSLPLAVTASALFFAAIHYNLVGFTDYLLVGISSAVLVYYAESLWPSIVLHIAINTLAIILTYLR